jgi:hypothetical protein
MRDVTIGTRSLFNISRLMEENAMLLNIMKWNTWRIGEKINSISMGVNGMFIEQLKQIFVSLYVLRQLESVVTISIGLSIWPVAF